MKEAYFAINAVNCLFSSLKTEVSLGSFFRLIQSQLPVTEINLSKTYMPFAQTLRVAWVNNDGVVTLWKTFPIPEEQRRLGRKILTEHSETFLQRRMVLDKHDLLYQYLTMIPESRLVPPFFFLRLVKEGLALGAIVFQCSRPLDEREIAMLGSLENLLCLAVNNFLQFHEFADLKEQLVRENGELRVRLERLLDENIQGRNGGLQDVVHKASMAAAVNTPVLLLGEPGSGKTRIAKLIHDLSARAHGPFVEVRCGAIPVSLLENVMFGQKGLVTREEERKGRMEMADGGTLLLDEVGDLPLAIQGRLAQFLETSIVERGEDAPCKVNVRILASSRKNLARMVKEGTFREELYYRLQVVVIDIPPLRERRQDIPSLVHAFLRQAASRYGLPVPQVSRAEMDKLVNHPWPGNIKELKAVLEEAMLSCAGKNLHTNLETGSGVLSCVESDPGALPDMDQAMRAYLTRCLKATHGRVEGAKGAAKVTGLTPSTFRFRCKRLGLNPKSFS